MTHNIASLDDIVHCNACGQKNRVPVTDSTDLPDGKKLICGACKADLDFTEADIIDDDDELDALDDEAAQP
jgi:transcription elongation factor Elf1